MIRITLPAHPEEHVALAVSPLHECVLSLHVLLGPKHHALHHDWVRRMRALDPALRREIETLGFVYRHQLPDLFIPSPDDAPQSFAQERRERQLGRRHEHAVEVSADNPLVLTPSVFVWPPLRVNCDPPWPLSLVYAAPALVREAEPRIPPAELLRILRALADDTRL